MEPKYIGIVRVSAGLVIRDTPRPKGQGGREIRSVPVGTQLDITYILDVGGVNYARLVPQNPLKPEWVRVAEADNSTVYVDVIELDVPSGENGDLIDAINHLARAIETLASKK